MHGKDNEILESREKAKTDFDKKLRAIHKDIELNDEYRDRIKQLENDLKGTCSPFRRDSRHTHTLPSSILDQRYTDRHTIRELEGRVTDLQATLNQREQEITRLRRDEEQRLQFLRSAIVEYIGPGTKHL